MEQKADFQVSYSVNNGVLEIVVTGNAIGFANNEKMLHEFDDIIKANNAKKTIIDVRDLGGRLAETDIYRFVRTFSSVIYDIQTAIVDLPEKASFADAVKHAGLSFTWFTDMDAARKWIKGK